MLFWVDLYKLFNITADAYERGEAHENSKFSN